MMHAESLNWRGVTLLVAAPVALLSLGASEPEGQSLSAAKCAELVHAAPAHTLISNLGIDGANWREAGLVVEVRGGKSPPLPAHCEVTAHVGARPATVGGLYKIAMRMRLPATWNGRYFFQGGGGSNGIVGDAIGYNGPGNKNALERGYAVITQDSGHDNATNKLATHGGDLVFGHDPQARADYGHKSLIRTYEIGRMLIHSAYGREPATKIFWGCSKGGQEGMAFAQRYPKAFDGIVAAAPGMSLPRAAVAEAWDVQQFASVLRADGRPITLEALKTAIPVAQMKLVADTVLETCDGDDGSKDGIIGAVGMCTSKRVVPALRKKVCHSGSTSTCLSGIQVTALANIMDGVRDKGGRQLYAPWAWDSGIAEPGWRVWKVGLENGPPALNVMLGGGSLAAVFTTPPTPLATDPAKLLPWQLAFDFNRDAAKIYATSGAFKTSAWQDIGMRSPDLSAYRANGGKLIIPHGVSDPVFSILDTIQWWREVDQRTRGRAADFTRVFPIPGMTHCGGGPATDQYDSLSALEDWVLNGIAPDSISAKAGTGTPWPGRERPLCRYPAVARENGNGAFACQTSKRR